MTLQQLNAGELKGATRVKIAEGLTEFPNALYELADTLEILDLTGNQLTDLPDEFASFQKLKILFLSNNRFEHLPQVLGQCQNLEMIGFKTNQIQTVSAEALPSKLRWLILTDNQIEQLPDCFERLPQMQKLMLAGNRLTSLPDSIASCHNLQLIRVSANQLTEFPKVLTQLPNLAWCAISGNPFCQEKNESTTLEEADLSAFEMKELLGEGASGHIYLAHHPESNEHKAIKLFKGGVTSDGYAKDEMRACITAGEHHNLVCVEAQIAEESPGLVMKLIPENYFNLGQPPSLESCTRDCFPKGFSLEAQELLEILRQATSALMHLHERDLIHGDFYAHNVLIGDQSHLLLGDFGAASHLHGLTKDEIESLIRMEKRALAHFIEDLWQQTELANHLEKQLHVWHDGLLQDRLSLSELQQQLEAMAG